MVNLIGDLAVTHRQYDAPLASDIAGLAGPNSRWLKSVDTVGEAGTLAVEAFEASYGPPPGPVSLIMPADVAWTSGASRAEAGARAGLKIASDDVIEEAGRAVTKAKRPALLVNGTALHAGGAEMLRRIEAQGVRVVTDTFMARHVRGGGLYDAARLPYFAEMAVETFADTDLLLIAGTKPPVAFFAYPNTAGAFTPKGARTLNLGGPDTDSMDAVSRLADWLDAPLSPRAANWTRPEPATGDKFHPHTIGVSLAAL